MARKSLDDVLTERFPGKTWDQIAEKLDLSIRGLWKLRHDNRPPRKATLASLRRAVGTKLRADLDAALAHRKARE